MAVLATPLANIGNLFHPAEGFFSPGDRVFRQRIDRRHIFPVRHQDIAGRGPQEIFRVAADVHILVAVHADPSDDQQCRDIFAHILNDLFEGLAVQQGGLDVGLLGLSDFAADVQVRLVDLREAAVDDFFVQLFLLLEAEHFAGFLIEDTGNAVKGGIVEIGIEGRDGLDRHVEGLA